MENRGLKIYMKRRVTLEDCTGLESMADWKSGLIVPTADILSADDYYLYLTNYVY